MIKESKYIIRRVIIGVLIALILSFINSCEVHAEVKPISNTGLKARYYPSSNWANINYNQWTTIPSENSLYGLQMNFENGTNSQYSPIGGGTYLFDFYIETNNLTNHLASCNGLNTNFEFVDGTTGNWVSASSNSSSTCLDSYYTLIGGNKTIHYLIQWQITDTFSYELFINEMRFTIYNFTGSGFVDYNGAYYIILGTLQDYDPQIVSNFKKLKEDNENSQATINSINSGTQNIINNQNQNTQDIINNQNQLNQNVINNQNQNTNSITNSISGATQEAIENANQNTQDIINNQNENFNNCGNNEYYLNSTYSKYTEGFLDSNGVIQNANGYRVTDFIGYSNKETSTMYKNFNGTGRYFCTYDINKIKVNCYNLSDYTNGEYIQLNYGDNIKYIRFTYAVLSSSNNIRLNIFNCKNRIDETNDSINDLNDSINDSSTASNEDFNDAIDSVNNAMPTNSTISSLITMPITFLQKIIDALNGTCSPIVIGELYEYNMSMPCINPSDYIGFIWNIIDVICSGFFAYYFGKKLVLIFHNITSMKEGGLKEAYD